MAKKNEEAKAPEGLSAEEQISLKAAEAKAERVPAPERTDPTNVVHGQTEDVKAAAEAERETAVAEATAAPVGVPEDQVNTVAPPPVKDDERAPYVSTQPLGYRAKSPRMEMAKSPNDVIKAPDKFWHTATRDRWGDNDQATLLQEQREIQRQIDEAEAKR